MQMTWIWAKPTQQFLKNSIKLSKLLAVLSINHNSVLYAVTQSKIIKKNKSLI
jgi:hypothetical protein